MTHKSEVKEKAENNSRNAEIEFHTKEYQDQKLFDVQIRIFDPQQFDKFFGHTPETIRLLWHTL